MRATLTLRDKVTYPTTGTCDVWLGSGALRDASADEIHRIVQHGDAPPGGFAIVLCGVPAVAFGEEVGTTYDLLLAPLLVRDPRSARGAASQER